MDKELLFNALAVIGAMTCVYLVVKAMFALVRFAQKPLPEEPSAPAPTPVAAVVSVPAPEPVEEGIPADHVAAIAGAVAMMFDHALVVHIEDIHTSLAWSSEGRWLHQTSHQPH